MKFEWDCRNRTRSYVKEETSRTDFEQYGPVTIEGARWRGPFEGYR